MPESRPTGPTLDELLEQTVFAGDDPRIVRLKGLWEDAKREAKDLFEKADQENYEHCLNYHRTCGTPDAEERARAEASALRQLLFEEQEERLGVIWADILGRVQRVMEDRAEERLDERAD